jgi:hypothetical protein
MKTKYLVKYASGKEIKDIKNFRNLKKVGSIFCIFFQFVSETVTFFGHQPFEEQF